jgi:arabinose-5-phosphate isomerase
MFSKSGNTKELINLINILKERNCYLIGICCDKNSAFFENCDFIIETPFNQEINGEINKIPTNSYLSHLLFSNILVSKLKNNITLDEYKDNHTSGNIGKKLMKIKDCMTEEFPKILLSDKILLHNVLLNMTKYKTGIISFTDKNNKLLGILTDGDIRKLLLKDENKKYISISDINKNFYYETNIEKYLFECKDFTYIPIINNDKLFMVKN